MSVCSCLFSIEHTYVSYQQTQTAVFTEIAEKLLAADLVTPSFLDNLMQREQKYPTGLSLKPVAATLTDIAIPHTESEFVKVTKIIPIKLVHPVKFKNMLNPSEDLNVSFLFMILNKNGQAQTAILAKIMDFINAQDKTKLQEFFGYTDQEMIFNFLKTNFKEEF